MSTENKRTELKPSALETFDNYTGDAIKGLVAVGAGGVDFVTDAIGTLVPGGNKFMTGGMLILSLTTLHINRYVKYRPYYYQLLLEVT